MTPRHIIFDILKKRLKTLMIYSDRETKLNEKIE